MKCPYCQKEMSSGSVVGDEYRLKWLPADKKLLFGFLATSAIPVGSDDIVLKADVPAYFCEDCNKIIFKS